jgi:UPF0755 protein
LTNDNNTVRVPDAVIPKQRAPVLTRVLGSLIGWGLVFGVAAVATGVWAWGVYTSEGPLKQTTVVTLPEGASRVEISKTLEDLGIISDARVMNGVSLVNGLRGATLKSGEYEFQAGTPMAGVLSAISAGRVVTYKLTVPEGWTSQMALARLNANDVLTGEPVAAVPEGSIIADTLVFRRGMTRAKLVQDMQGAQTKLVDEIWAKRPADSIIKTKEEMVTLASIVEKETGQPEERPRVAAVFLNRLKKGMRLQSDPTIIYGIMGGAGKLDRPLTRADIDAATPYNTYTIDGLPPGPIANPGRLAMEAVLAPAQTEDLYFVADGTGGHAFAATLEAHNDNVKKWRDIEKNGIQLPGVAPEPEAAPVQNVEQTPLPVVEAPKPEDAPVNSAEAVEAAAENAKKTQAVPDPAEGTGAAQPAAAAPKPAEPPPLPVAKKPKPVVAEATPVIAKPVVLKPGSVVKVGDKLLPIPKQKVAKP